MSAFLMLVGLAALVWAFIKAGLVWWLATILAFIVNSVVIAVSEEVGRNVASSR